MFFEYIEVYDSAEYFPEGDTFNFFLRECKYFYCGESVWEKYAKHSIGPGNLSP